MTGSNTRTRILLATFIPLLLFVLLGVGAAVEAIPRIIEGLVLQRQTALAEATAAGVAGEMQGHLGIAGMVERARLFGGTLDVITSPGEGTTVRLRLEDGVARPNRTARMGQQTVGVSGEGDA